MDEMGELNPTFTSVYSSLALSECFSAPINPLVLGGNSFSAAHIIASLVGLSGLFLEMNYGGQCLWCLSEFK